MEKKATVYVRHLNAPHQEESLTKFMPLNEALKKEVKEEVIQDKQKEQIDDKKENIVFFKYSISSF